MVVKFPSIKADSHGGIITLSTTLCKVWTHPNTKFTVIYQDMEHPMEDHSPPSMVVTNLKPYIVIVDETKKEATIFELTCPMEHNINRQHK